MLNDTSLWERPDLRTVGTVGTMDTVSWAGLCADGNVPCLEHVYGMRVSWRAATRAVHVVSMTLRTKSFTSKMFRCVS
jgi:hypothetical protein